MDHSAGIALLLVGWPFILKACGFGAKKVWMMNPNTGQTKKGYYGYSWTYLLFGWWVPLLRGEVTIALAHLIFTLLTLGVWQLIVSFLYNRQYTQRRIAEGFKFADYAYITDRAARRLNIDLNFHKPVQIQAETGG